MNNLSQSDLYGLDRREIVTYDYQVTDEGNVTEIYVSNEDGSLVGANYTGCIDNICFNNPVITGNSIPIAPDYKHIGNITFTSAKETTIFDNLIILLFIIGFVVFVAALFFIVLRFVRFIRYGKRR